MESTQVVIIGGGATGAGILWDLSLRGISAVLLEQGDIANGATGRCHGLLHSGGRYAVKDPESARDCAAENRIIRTIAPHCVDDTGGLFVQTSHDDPAFFDQWWRAAEDAGIPSRRIGADEARSLEPNLAADILGAFTCQDAHVDVFRLVLANLEAAAARAAFVIVTCAPARNPRSAATLWSMRQGHGHRAWPRSPAPSFPCIATKACFWC